MRKTVIFPLIVSFSLAGFILLNVFCRSARNETSIGPYREPPEIQELQAGLAKLQDIVARKEFLRTWIAKFDHSVEAHRAYQDIRNGWGLSTEVLAEYRARFDRAQGDAMSAYLFGRLHSGADAERYYKKALEADPDYYWAHLGLANTYLQETKPPRLEDAREQLKIALTLAPERPNAYLNLLTLYQAEKDNLNIRDTLGTLLRFFPDSDEYFVAHARLAYSRPEDYRTALENRAREHPQSVVPPVALGNFHLGAGNPKKAVEYYESALAKAGRSIALDVPLHLDTAQALQALGNEDEALGHIREALAIDPGAVAAISRNPRFDPLKKRPEFEAMMKEAGEKLGFAPAAPPKKKTE